MIIFAQRKLYHRMQKKKGCKISMTDYAVHKMLLLRKRMYQLSVDVAQFREVLCPHDSNEIGSLVTHCADTSWSLYFRLCEATKGYDWPSHGKKYGKKRTKGGN